MSSRDIANSKGLARGKSGHLLYERLEEESKPTFQGKVLAERDQMSFVIAISLSALGIEKHGAVEVARWRIPLYNGRIKEQIGPMHADLSLPEGLKIKVLFVKKRVRSLWKNDPLGTGSRCLPVVVRQGFEILSCIMFPAFRQTNIRLH